VAAMADRSATDAVEAANITSTVAPNSTHFNDIVFCKISSVKPSDQCAYMHAVEDCQSTSIFDYSDLAFCRLENSSWFMYILLSMWLVVLFANLILLVDSRVVPNITTMAKLFGMPDSLAGITLLALGNGAADIFSASAAIGASEKSGATLASAGLLGGGLFVVSIVFAVLAIKFQPDCTPKQVSRDAGSYMAAIVVVIVFIADNRFYIWEGVTLLLMYVLYVFVSLRSEGKVETQATETEAFAALGHDPTMPSNKNSGGTKGTSNGLDQRLLDENAALLPSPWQEVQTVRGAVVMSGILKESSYYTFGQLWRFSMTRAVQEIFHTRESSWKDKSKSEKLVIMIQLPISILIVLTTPVVRRDHPSSTWDRNRFAVMTTFSVPTIVLIFADDAFYSNDTINMPLIIPGLILGVTLGVLIMCKCATDRAPKRIAVFSILGFIMGLSFIYLISDEIVSSLRTMGFAAGVPSSLVGTTVLGIGNGMCDLIANYMMARAGFPSIAISAIYAGPMFNLLVGLGLAIVHGNSMYSTPYIPVTSDMQIFTAALFTIAALLLGVGFSFRDGSFLRSHGISVGSCYILFLLITIAMHAKD